MKIDTQLISIRADFDNQRIDEATFTDRVNTALGTIAASATDAEKIAAFDKLAAFVATNYEIRELDGGMQYIKSDLDHYFFEEAFAGLLGKSIWGFYNATYEAG